MTGIPKIVARRLQADIADSSHPEANQLTALAESALAPGERKQILAHLAQCGDCREVLWLSAPEALESLPVPVPMRSSWLAWPVLRWGTAIACVVLVGAAVGLHYRARPTLESQIAAEFAASRQDTAPANEIRTPAAAVQAPAEQATRQKSAFAAQRGNNLGDLKQAPLQDKVAAAVSSDESREVTQMKTKTSETKTTSEPVEVTAGTVAPENATVSNVPHDEVSEFVPGRAKDALQEGATGGGIAGGNAPLLKMRSMAAPVAPNQPPLPLAAGIVPRWTVSADGSLQRSLDSGKTWQTIPFANPATFRALTANGLQIWVGGLKGVLYHSSDAGQRWKLIQPAVNGQQLSSDIVRIEFTDTLHGTVTTADQQIWQTSDEGATWQKQ